MKNEKYQKLLISQNNFFIIVHIYYLFIFSTFFHFRKMINSTLEFCLFSLKFFFLFSRLIFVDTNKTVAIKKRLRCLKWRITLYQRRPLYLKKTLYDIVLRFSCPDCTITRNADQKRIHHVLLLPSHFLRRHSLPPFLHFFLHRSWSPSMSLRLSQTQVLKIMEHSASFRYNFWIKHKKVFN